MHFPHSRRHFEYRNRRPRPRGSILSFILRKARNYSNALNHKRARLSTPHKSIGNRRLTTNCSGHAQAKRNLRILRAAMGANALLSLARFIPQILHRISAKVSCKKIKSIPSGLIPIIEANASCIASLVGEIVVVSESLRHFYYFMTIAFFGENLGIKMTDRVSALCIAYRVMNQSEALDFDLDPRGELPKIIENKIQELVSDQMQFTFGHEYAHYLCGHVSSGNTPLPGNREKARAFAHALEFEADAQAVKLVRQSPSAADRIAHGGMFVLIFLDLLYRLKDQYGLRRLPVSETHPAPIDRLYALQQSLGSRSPMSLNDIEHSLAVCTQLVAAFSQFLKGSPRPDILSFYGSIYLPSYVSRIKLDRIDF